MCQSRNLKILVRILLVGKCLLWKIGQILEHNFFIDLAEAFPPIESTQEDVLKKQVDELQRENELYKKMFVKSLI